MRAAAVLLLACVLLACGPSTSAPQASGDASASATPFVTASPPATLAPGFGRLQGHVTDANTHRPVEGVCVVIASEGSCQPASPRGDDEGFWWIDLPAGVDWDVSWQRTGYETAKIRVTTTPEVQTIDVQLKPSS